MIGLNIQFFANEVFGAVGFTLTNSASSHFSLGSVFAVVRPKLEIEDYCVLLGFTLTNSASSHFSLGSVFAVVRPKLEIEDYCVLLDPRPT